MVDFVDSLPTWISREQQNGTMEEEESKEKPVLVSSMKKISTDLGLSEADSSNLEESNKIMVKALLQLSEWERNIHVEGGGGQSVSHQALDQQTLRRVLNHVERAKEIDGDNYYVWHAWALNHYTMVQASHTRLSSNSFDSTSPPTLAGSNTTTRGSLSPRRSHGQCFSFSPTPFGDKKEAKRIGEEDTSYVVEAMRGFFRSIALGGDQPVAFQLQDTLRLLTLLFSYGQLEPVYQVAVSSLDEVNVETWLGVVPQLIARMHTREPKIRSILHDMLLNVGTRHPQSLVYPITVALQTESDLRKDLAKRIIHEMRLEASELVDEATLVSQELMRVAITRHESWHEGLERAAQCYLNDGAMDEMAGILMKLHASFEESVHNPDGDTFRNISFQHCYGRDISRAKVWLDKYEDDPSVSYLHQAWEVYHQMFKSIAKQLKTLKTLELRHIAPSLLQAKNLNLAVPGTYLPNQPTIRIQSFGSNVDVISSKQKPRKMYMTGSDGVKYGFLLKGHEDLRQDERVMQLFGLINALLDSYSTALSRNMRIRRYSVLPLSDNSGVLGWVENTDTMNDLVKEYREPRDIRLTTEHRLLASHAPDFDKMTPLMKQNAFEEVLRETTGTDLSKMFWLKSRSSEVWIERRTVFTISLAVNSIAGYVLGLGDRHPSNLMIDRISGGVVHIDFGDCFEVAMNRSTFPETIPFRLTRMLIRNMEVSGVDGTFRSTCERVLRVVRENRDSLMAMLEAFVYDPLISWRLLARGSEVEGMDEGKEDEKEEEEEEEDEGGNMVSQLTHALEEKAKDDEENQKMNIRPLSTRKNNEAMSGGDMEELNEKAVEVIQRIQTKLNGTDYRGMEGQGIGLVGEVMNPEEHVDQLIDQATSPYNLSQLYMGWCPFW